MTRLSTPPDHDLNDRACQLVSRAAVAFIAGALGLPLLALLVAWRLAG